MVMDVKERIIGLIGWIVICFSVSAIGAAASLQAKSFYATLAQPEWAPPGGVFGPVWSVLFLMMSFSAWLIWVERYRVNIRLPLIGFLVQLALNALWSWMFFAWHNGAGAFIVIVLLVVMILSCITMFWRISKLASGLLIPYVVWVVFAAALNYGLWQLNPNVI